MMYIKCCYSSQKGSYRENNEDNLYICGDWLKYGHKDDSGVRYMPFRQNLFGVFDGMGGKSDGEAASLKAAETLHVVRNIERFFTEANKAVCSIGRGKNKKSGSTAAVLSFSGGRFTVANIGDSRIYLLRDKTIARLTVDHTMAEVMTNAGLITKEDVKIKYLRNYLTQYLGYEGEEGEDIMPNFFGTYKINDGDVFILCSDGVWNSIDEELLAKTSLLNMDNPAEEIVKLAYKNGARDNASVIVVYICNEPFFEGIKRIMR